MHSKLLEFAHRLPLMMVLTASCICVVSAMSELSTHELFLKPAQNAEHMCAPSSGNVVFAGEGGTVVRISADNGFESYERVPTISPIVGIEHTTDGLIALNAEHQVFRKRINDWQLERSYYSAVRSFLNPHYYALQLDTVLCVFRNETGELVGSVAIPATIVLTVLTCLSDDVWLMGDSAGWLHTYDANALEFASSKVDPLPITNIFKDATGAIIVSTDSCTYTKGSTSTAWEPLVPRAFLAHSDTKSVGSIRVKRTFENRDTLFHLVSVFDSTGPRIADAIIVHLSDSSIDDAKIIYSAYESIEPKATIVAGSNRIIQGTISGWIRVLSRTDFGAFEWKIIRPDENTLQSQGAVLPTYDGRLVWTSPFRVGPVATTYAINTVSTLNENSQVITDTLHLPDCVGKKSFATFALVNADSTKIVFEFDTVVTTTNAHSEWTCGPKLLTLNSTVAKLGSTIGMGLSQTLTLSTDNGVTWHTDSLDVVNAVRSICVVDSLTVVATSSAWPSGTNIHVTVNGGVTWRRTLTDLKLRGIVKLDNNTIVMHRIKSVQDENLKLTLYKYELSTELLETLIDTTLDGVGFMIGAVALPYGNFVLATGKYGLIKMSTDWRSFTIDTSATLRFTPLNHLNIVSTGNHALCKTNSGHAVHITNSEVSVIDDDNYLHLRVSNLWPVPTGATISCRVLIPFANDYPAATAFIYDQLGRVMADVTDDFKSGTYSDYWAEFKTRDLDLQSGPYLMVLKSGKFVSSKNFIYLL